MNQSNDKTVTQNTKRISAIKKYIRNAKTEIPDDGQLLKPADAIAIYQESLDKRAAAAAAHAAYTTAVAERKEAETRLPSLDRSLRNWVVGHFGGDSVEVGEFGFSTRKPAAVTADVRAKAVLLARATREARGTKGKRQKQKIKGSLVDPAAPAAPAKSSAVTTSNAPATAGATALPVVNAPGGGGA